MIDHSIVCFDGIVWFEPNLSPDVPLDEHNHNITRPLEGEVRHVCIRHEHQEPIGGRMWLLFQSALSLANGFPYPDEELETAAIIEVEILSQIKVPKKKTYWDDVQYQAQVRPLRVLGLTQIIQAFSECKPNWPQEDSLVQLSQTPTFTFVEIVAQNVSEWFVLTRTEPPRLIMECCALRDEPFTVCNCEWDWGKWPHRVRKTPR